MKKIVALFTAMVFALTLGIAFAEEKAATPSPAEKTPAAEKSPAKHKKHIKHKKQKKETATPEAAAPATK